MLRRYNRISEVCKDLAEQAFKAYTGKKDYKKAIAIYCILSESICVPKDIGDFSKTMLARLSKKIEDNA
ncbi:hypothetical protein CHL78_011365 [Romboutsia weinsteinii]|uniref:Uncharacterized protein n=1 Tax=Romboutsia weinsteinii TaxID=2020949 RepID=A0A371J2M7_9FIRM|nr:hypothetical protein [Romboutsia weinsteinii]RDY26927.1 hypothetical protein CHL78_011365 [Romboutsia weinsteinii]